MTETGWLPRDDGLYLVFKGPPHREHGKRGMRAVYVAADVLGANPSLDVGGFVRDTVEMSFAVLYGYRVPLEDCVEVGP